MDLVFTVLKPIKSLPPWTGARWNALFRLVARAAGVNPEEAFEALIPEQWTRQPWWTGDQFSVRLVTNPDNWRQTEAFSRFLRGDNLVGEGEFVLGHSLELTAIYFPTIDIPNRRVNPEIEAASAPLLEEQLAAEMETLANLTPPWRLVLTTPLRLVRPANAPGSQEFAGPDFFSWPLALDHLIKRIRLANPESLEPQLPFTNDNQPVASPLTVMSHTVTWHNLAYNRDRKMRLGGLIGTILINGRPDRQRARRLVWGQYLGVGKNGRFGFGFYRIPALDPERLWSLFPAPSPIREP
jgi:hypothetical protein